MLISIHDQTLQRVGFLSNENPLTPDFKNDKFHRYLAQGASTFDFTVNKRKNGVLQDYMKHLNEHAYFSFKYEEEDFLFDSVIVEENDDEVTFNCLTLNLEMRNEEVKKLENSTSHNIQWYFDKMGLINFAQIKLGKNEVSDSTRVIKYDSEDTKLSRLISVIQNFDAEFEFVTTLKRDGSLDNIILNIYKKNDGDNIQGVGQNRNDVILTFGENVTGVSRKVDKFQIFNSLFVTGKDGLNWKDKSWSVKNAEGVEEFYKRAGESYAKAPLSAQMFPSQIQSTKGDIYTNKNKETEYTSHEAMWGYALSELRKNAYPLVEYEVQATSGVTVSSMGDGTPLHIGDTVRIQDMNFMDSNGDVGLFLSARVSELEISFTNPTNNKITFSNYIKLKSEVSDDLLDRMQSIIDQNTPYRSEIMTTNGIQFKNGTGTTDLSAHIFKGADAVETVADTYTWFRDGTPMAQTQAITVSAASVPEKAVYSYEAKINGAVVGTASVTITNVNDGAEGKPGEDGNTYYPHTAYAYSADGQNGFTIDYPNLNLEQHTEMLVDGSDKLLYGGKGGATATMTHEDASISGIPSIKNAVRITQTVKGQSGWRSPTGSQKGSYAVVPAGKYTHSVFLKNNGNTDVTINLQLGTSNKETDQTSNVKYINRKVIVPANSDWKLYSAVLTIPSDNSWAWSYVYTDVPTVTADWSFAGLKVEAGEVQTPWMPHESEVKPEDWPTYIGAYSDTNPSASTDPSKYTWALFKGNDGEKGDNGDPGKVVQQDTEPEERFKDMLWQYTGTVPLNVTGLTAQPNMTYVWNGEAWQIWFLNPANLQAVNAWITNAMIANAAIDFAKINSATIENLSAVNSILGDVKAGKITNEFEYDSSVGKTKGTLVIDEIGLKMDYIENGDKTKPGSLQVSPSGMTVSRYNTEGVRETASYTQKGMVMSTDVLPMQLSWEGITATANYERSFDVVYITGRGNWGKFEANKERFFGGLPKSVWPQYEIASGASSMGGAQNMAVKITTDGRIGITSSVAKDNCYAGFSITYRAIPNVS
ncbi:phage tail protein [Lactococcus garvieae]|uniref:phage tail protein n=1 Tax=Lactococcus garvieae TaxID=1363 RepID=UPI0002E5468A|nr:phage tail protein [Lactococcus garvieae]